MNSRVSLSSSEKMNLFGNLSTMLAAGVPLLEVVNSIMEDTKGSQLKILTTLKNDLMQGKRIHSSFSQFPRVFDKVTINLIKASEEAGTLETVLRDLRDHIQKEMEFTDKIKFALLYPSLILIVFAGMLLTILIVVVPRIATVFSRLKVKLPLPTRILIFISDLLLKHTFFLLGGTAHYLRFRTIPRCGHARSNSQNNSQIQGHGSLWQKINRGFASGSWSHPVLYDQAYRSRRKKRQSGQIHGRY